MSMYIILYINTLYYIIIYYDILWYIYTCIHVCVHYIYKMGHKSKEAQRSHVAA